MALKSITDIFPAFGTWPTALPMLVTAIRPGTDGGMVQFLYGQKIVVACVDGNPAMEERLDLARLVAGTGARNVFEIGTYDGATAAMLGTIPSVEHVLTLNIPAGVVPALPILETDHYWIDIPRPTVWGNKVVQLWGDSATFDYAPYAGQQDIVFVMGAHSQEYIDNDLAAAFRMVAPTGLVIWHGGQANTVPATGNKYDLYMIGARMAVVRPLDTEQYLLAAAEHSFAFRDNPVDAAYDTR